MHMNDYIKQLNNILASGNRKILENKGKISHQQAIEKAEIEYKKYQKNNLSPVENDYLENLKEVAKNVKKNQGKLKRE